MLTLHEYNGLKEILNDIDDEVIFSVLETVTKRMFTTSLRHEAIEKILSCIEKPSDLLRRQKITKKCLFSYLVKKDSTVLAEWNKPTLVKKCLELWFSTESCKESDYSEGNIKVNSCMNVENVTAHMGVEFCKWFFRILNTQDGFGPQHFWPSCSLSAQLHSMTDQKEVSLSGANDVTNFLATLIVINKYYFHANDSKDSILLQEEQHGLIKIIVHGVLHQFSNCVGLFDSAFGLVKHPEISNTYKIQVVKVRMQVNNAPQGSLPVNNLSSICQST